MKKLLAVVVMMGAPGLAFADAPRTLRNGVPAAGNVMSKSGRQRTPTELEAAQQHLRWAEYSEARAIEDLATTPRTLPSGAPACGNTNSKGKPPPCTVERAEMLHRGRAANAASAVATASKARTDLLALVRANGQGRTVAARRAR